MNRRKVSAKDFRSQKKDNTLPLKASIAKLRIGSGVELPGTVPVIVNNQSWPVHVYPEVYLDVQHIQRAELKEKTTVDSVNTVSISFNEIGCQRLSAITDDINLTVVLFIDNYPVLNVAVTERVYEANIEVNVFQNTKQAQSFINAIKEQKT